MGCCYVAVSPRCTWIGAWTAVLEALGESTGLHEIRRVAQPLFKLATALAGFVVRIELAAEFKETVLQFRHGHVLWPEIDVEQRAKLPRLGSDQAPLALEPLVERSSGERGEEGDLDLIQSGLANEREDIVEHVGRISIQAEDETAIHGDSMRLDLRNGGGVTFELARFPVCAELNAVQACATRAFEPDEDLLTA